MSQIKYNRASRLAKMGKYGYTFDAIWGKLDRTLVASCTGGQLAKIIDTMYSQKEYGYTECMRDLGLLRDSRI